jgi:hypothetical protein
MAVTYENVIYDRVINNLHSIMADEFSIPIYFDAHEGNQSFLITPVSDEIAERLKRLLYNNRNYAVSGTTKFFNGIVNGINYERDEDNEELLRSILSFTCTTMELV